MEICSSEEEVPRWGILPHPSLSNLTLALVSVRHRGGRHVDARCGRARYQGRGGKRNGHANPAAQRPKATPRAASLGWISFIDSSGQDCAERAVRWWTRDADADDGDGFQAPAAVRRTPILREPAARAPMVDPGRFRFVSPRLRVRVSLDWCGRSARAATCPAARSHLPAHPRAHGRLTRDGPNQPAHAPSVRATAS